MAFGGGIVGVSHFALRILQVCASAIILGIFSYFLAVLADHDLKIQPWVAAVEGISGAATFYSILAAIGITWASKTFLTGLAMAFDLAFGAAFIAIAIMARDGASTCTGPVETPLGNGNADGNASGRFGDQGFGIGDGQKLTYLPSAKSACQLQKAAFAISIIGIFLFFLSIFTQRLYSQHRRRSKQHGASTKKPFVDTSKIRWRFWRRNRLPTTGRNASAVEYYPDEASVGSIALTDQQSLESKPPRYTRIFGWGKKNGVRAGEPQTAAAQPAAAREPATPNSLSNSADGYGYRNPYGGSSAFSGPWQGDGYANYEYGQSAVGDVGYAHGYGNSPYNTNY